MVIDSVKAMSEDTLYIELIIDTAVWQFYYNMVDEMDCVICAKW